MTCPGKFGWPFVLIRTCIILLFVRLVSKRSGPYSSGRSRVSMVYFAVEKERGWAHAFIKPPRLQPPTPGPNSGWFLPPAFALGGKGATPLLTLMIVA